MAKRKHVLPGFGLTMGYTWIYLGVIVLLPFAGLLLKTSTIGWDGFWRTVTSPQVVASYKVSFGISLLAALTNGIFGVIAAWVLARYEFPGRKLLDAITDLPFALPTAVAGIALTALYGPNEWIGQFFSPYGIKISFTQIGIYIALTFIGLPFVVRTVQPVILELSAEVEEAAATLGANRWQTFRKVILPTLLPSILTGITLSYGRAVGEYGSVVFISGNLPFRTEITPLMIVSKLEAYDYSGAAAIGFVMLVASFAIVLVSNSLQAWDARRRGIA
jgi:sulfate transport system permease protein